MGKAAVPTGTWRYYNGVLLMFGLLHLSGNFKIYMPKEAEEADAEPAAAEAPAETPAESPAEEAKKEATEEKPAEEPEKKPKDK